MAEQTVSEKDQVKQETVQVKVGDLRHVKGLFQDVMRGLNLVNLILENDDMDCATIEKDYITSLMLGGVISSLKNLCGEFYRNLGVPKPTEVDHG